MTNPTFELEKVLEVVSAFSGEKDYFTLLSVILDKMMELTNADAGTLYVAEDEKLFFRIMKTVSMGVYSGPKDKIELPPIALDEQNIENISAYTAIKNEVVSVDDVYSDTRFNFQGPKNYDKITGYKTGSMLVFPLTTNVGGEPDVIGVIQLINALDRHDGEIISFNDACDVSILHALANISANTLANVRYAKEIDELLNSFVQVMTTAIDERSIYNVNHTYHVAALSEKFAFYLSTAFPKNHPFFFTDNRRDQLVMAAYLHDIGKIITPLAVMDKSDRLGPHIESVMYKFELKKRQIEIKYHMNQMPNDDYIAAINEIDSAVSFINEINASGFLPDEKLARVNELAAMTYVGLDGAETPILSEDELAALSVRKGTLTQGERKIMEEHASITGRLLDRMKFNKYYKSVATWARSHHEYLDGTGYPLGLSDGELPLEVRILTMLDIFDALVATDRPYKKAMPIDRALGVLESMVGEGKLDSNLVELFTESRIWEAEKQNEE